MMKAIVTNIQPRARALIRKASGEKVPFDVRKLRNSLQRSKAEAKYIEEVIQTIIDIVYDGMTTKQIHKKAFALLRKKSRSSAGRYKLKSAMLELGPSGYAFERFVSAILQKQGYDTELNAIVKGHCVSHEVDVIAERNKRRCMIECKFHGDKDRFSDVKVALYIHSRFKDVESAWHLDPEHSHKTLEGWLVTNTRFSKDAQRYGDCMGLKMISWSLPSNGSLRELIDASGLHPVTSLTLLSKTEKRALLDQNVVLCADILENAHRLSWLGISKIREKNILAEAKELSKSIKRDE